MLYIVTYRRGQYKMPDLQIFKKRKIFFIFRKYIPSCIILSIAALYKPIGNGIILKKIDFLISLNQRHKKPCLLFTVTTTLYGCNTRYRCSFYIICYILKKGDRTLSFNMTNNKVLHVTFLLFIIAQKLEILTKKVPTICFSYSEAFFGL